VAPGALYPARRIEFWEEADDHALSLPTAGALGKPAVLKVVAPSIGGPSY